MFVKLVFLSAVYIQKISRGFVIDKINWQEEVSSEIKCKEETLTLVYDN